MTVRMGILVAVGLTVLSMMGCKGGGDVPFYHIEAPVAEVAAGAGGEVRIRFVAAEGYHWNKDYPARFRIDEAKGLTVKKKTMSKADFHDNDGVGLLPISVKGESVGETTLEGTASFSVCNSSECRILKGIPVKVPVRVR